MGREIRKVPENWKHPKRVSSYSGKEEFEPMFDDYVRMLEYYRGEVDKFIKHMTEVWKDGKTIIYDTTYTDVKEVYEYFTEDDCLEPPTFDDYIPEGEWFQLFETVSEGTPLSPPFKTKDELVEWLVNNRDYWDHQWTRPQAEGIVGSGHALSGMMTGGKFYTSEQVAELQNKEEK